MRNKFLGWLVIISQIYASLAQATSTLIELDPLLPEKRLQVGCARKAEKTSIGIEIITDESKWHPQLKSEPIVLDPYTGFELPFTIDLKQGGVFIGLLAPDESHYLVYKTCHTPRILYVSLLARQRKVPA